MICDGLAAGFANQGPFHHSCEKLVYPDCEYGQKLENRHSSTASPGCGGRKQLLLRLLRLFPAFFFLFFFQRHICPLRFNSSNSPLNRSTHCILKNQLQAGEVYCIDYFQIRTRVFFFFFFFFLNPGFGVGL